MSAHEMTFDQIFAGRMILIGAQKHLAQEFVYYPDGETTLLGAKFRTPAGERAFFTVESLLVELEREFDAKKKRCHRKTRRVLDRRADRQVIA